jgi:hypothetical protein
LRRVALHISGLVALRMKGDVIDLGGFNDQNRVALGLRAAPDLDHPQGPTASEQEGVARAPVRTAVENVGGSALSGQMLAEIDPTVTAPC